MNRPAANVPSNTYNRCRTPFSQVAASARRSDRQHDPSRGIQVKELFHIWPMVSGLRTATILSRLSQSALCGSACLLVSGCTINESSQARSSLYTPRLCPGHRESLPPECSHRIQHPPAVRSLLWKPSKTSNIAPSVSSFLLIFIEIPLLLRICPTSAKFDAFIRRFTTNYMSRLSDGAVLMS